MNISDLIARQARSRPDAVALARKEFKYTHAQLEGAVAHVAARLAGAGLAPGQLVAVAMRTSPLHLIAILALARLGAISFPLAPGDPAPARRALAERFGVTAVVSDFLEFAVDDVPLVLLDPGWAQPKRDGLQPGQPADPLWRVNLSSGTTGTPKGVPATHEAIVNNVLLSRTVTRTAPPQRYLCFRGLDSMSGLRPCLIHLAAGGAVVFGNSTEPEDFFEAVKRHQATHVNVSSGLLRTLLRHAPQGGPSCPSLIHLDVGGAALPQQNAQEAMARITPHVHASYGSTETGRIATARPDMLRRLPGCSGRLSPWVEAQTVDEDDQALPTGASGILRYRGIGFADSYYRDPEATVRFFRGGWFYPGDIGRLEHGELLYAEARADEVINVGGRKVSPGEVEAVLERHPDVAEAAAFGVRSPRGDRLYAAVVLRRAAPESVLVEHCRAPLGSSAPQRVFALPSLPRNAAGKVVRKELAQRFAAEATGRA